MEDTYREYPKQENKDVTCINIAHKQGRANAELNKEKAAIKLT